MPPISTKAPKCTMDATTPVRISPTFRSPRICSRCSRWLSCSHSRLDSTTLLRILSISKILASRVCPRYGWRSRTLRKSTSEAGKKPRSPTSMMRPPLTASMTVPLTMPSPSLMAMMLSQARSYWARFLERISRPSRSSRCSTEASITSPTFTISWVSTSLRMESSRA